MRVAGYVRVSIEEQAEEGFSIPEQIDTIQKWCKDNGHPPATIYIDDGYSAKDLRRPDIKRLIGEVKQKSYDLVVTTKLNRLSRKLLDILDTIDMFEKNGCSYASVRESFDTSTYVGRMQMQMLGVIAEFDRERIADDVRTTMKSIARKASETKKVFTQPCYGYDVIDGMYLINEEEAKAINHMADLIISGKGCAGTARIINSPPYNYRAKYGNSWTETTVRQLMRRETLKGQIVYNRTYKKNGKTYTRPQEEWIIIEDHHPAILSKQKWDELQRVMDGRKTAGKQADNERYMLSGLLVCGHCGYKMKGICLTKRDRPGYAYFKYVCSSYQLGRGCFHHHLKRDDIEEFIIDQIKEVAKAGKSSKLALAVAAPKSVEGERQQLEVQLAKLDARMQKQIEMFEEDLISKEDFKKARDRIDEQRKQLAESIELLMGPSRDIDTNDVKTNVNRHIGKIQSADRLVIKNAIRQIISKIEVLNGEDIKIVYHST